MMTQKKPRILLVDDDRDMCESLADVLGLDGSYDVQYTTSPGDAITKVRDNAYDLMILDYKMPEMNGIDLLKELKKIRPSSSIFLLTAFISNELIEQAKKEGASKVLSKFIWPDDILQHIRQTLG